ncbi:cryptochrome/photolyase family protein [Pseudonocardia nantongensis]|uniref:cryptochrome/photolyase family protein n=1 Tax=Pseudonocardia nantongensis TaxID=1181885 RepID=UPI00397A68C5
MANRRHGEQCRTCAPGPPSGAVPEALGTRIDEALDGVDPAAPLWCFADQLGPAIHGLAQHTEREVVLVESSRALRRRRYHRQKLHLVLSAMRHLDYELGDRATLHRTATYREALAEVGRPVVVHEPTSWAAARFVADLHEQGLVAAVLPTTTFALPRADFADWAGAASRFTMETFYRAQRRRFDVLMDGDQPVGGTWNLDRSNRERPPKGRRTLGVPEPWWPQEDDIDRRVRSDLDAMDLPTVGGDGPRRFAVTSGEARAALRRFVDHRLEQFGPYEDAVMAGDPTMAHSLLSVPFNLGLLHPLEAVRAAEHAYRDGTASLRSVEGFVRQILGWREYIWHLYWHFGPDYEAHNELGADTPLPDWWTGLDADAVRAACLSHTLSGVHETGWVHHIPRLMILGNHALQRGYHPRQLSEWFATSFVDGFAWVMPPNVIGMSQHADGGRLATKPYAAGGAYLDRMTDHCRECVFDPSVRVGENACPFTAGYWQFVHRHRELLSANHRTGRAVAQMHKLPDLDALLEQEAHRDRF